MGRIGIFLDRDGTINEEVDFLRSTSDLRLIPGSADAIREANERNWGVFVVTNQSGIARGILSETTLDNVHAALMNELTKHNARIDAFYYCPHHPEIGNETYRRSCECRKPNIGMLEQAAREFDIDLAKSFVIGDRLLDVQTGRNAGATTVLVLTGYGKKELELCRANDVRIDYIAKDLLDAIQFVKRTVQQKKHAAC